MLKKLITDILHDDRLYDIEGVAFIVMIICVLAFFPIHQLIPALLGLVLVVFGVSALIGFGIRIIFRIRDIISFKDNVYAPMFEAQERERELKKNQNEESTKSELDKDEKES